MCRLPKGRTQVLYVNALPGSAWKKKRVVHMTQASEIKHHQYRQQRKLATVVTSHRGGVHLVETWSELPFPGGRGRGEPERCSDVAINTSLSSSSSSLRPQTARPTNPWPAGAGHTSRALGGTGKATNDGDVAVAAGCVRVRVSEPSIECFLVHGTDPSVT